MALILPLFDHLFSGQILDILVGSLLFVVRLVYEWKDQISPVVDYCFRGYFPLSRICTHSCPVQVFTHLYTVLLSSL